MTNQPETEAAPEQPIVWQVVGEHETILNVMADGMALMGAQNASAAEVAPPDIAAGELPELSDVARSVRLLAEILIADLAMPSDKTSRDAERSEAIQSITDAVGQARLRVSRSRREDALADVAELLRETGLEFHDLELALATSPDGTDVLIVQRLAIPVAHASLIPRLFQRADSFTAIDPFLSLERAASSWFFFRWSDGAGPGDPEYTEFPRMIREQEWSLVSRDTMSTDEPVIASFAGDDDDDVPPRQRHLADAYMRSTVGIFEVTEVDGNIVTVRDVIDGQTRRFYEHNENAQPYRGLLLLGRLIPIAEQLWLRSPGAIYVTSESHEFRDMLAETLTRLGEGLPVPLALEALISIAIYNTPVPVPSLPAPTIAEAQAALLEATQQLEDLGLLGDVPGGEVPPDILGQLDSAALDTVGLGVDQTMAEWLAALLEQTSLVDVMPQRAPSNKKKKHKRTKSRHKKRPRH